MGIREDQFAGLSEEAIQFLGEYEVPDVCCPTCKRAFPRNYETVDVFYGMFDNEYPLHRHVLKDGRTADEFLQAALWSSGPVHFLGLRVSDGTEFLWTDEAIEEFIV